MMDVVIIGAGPAGIMAARELQMAGHSVVILEKGAEQPVKLQESVRVTSLSRLYPPDVRQTLAKMLQANMGLDVRSADGRRRIRIEYQGHEDWGYLDRGRFDLELRKQTVSDGYDVRYRKAVLGVVFHQRMVCLQIKTENAEQELPARLVIDTSGKSCVVRNALNLSGQKFRFDGRTGIFSHFVLQNGVAAPCECPLTLVPLSEANIYVIRISATRWSVGVTLFGHQRSGDAAEEYWKVIKGAPWLSAALAQAQQVLPILSVQNTQFIADRVADPQYLLAGDAGAFIEPFFCNGLEFALATGTLSGRAAHEILTAGNPLQVRSALAAYEDAFRQVLKEASGEVASALPTSGLAISRRHLDDPHIPYPIAASLLRLTGETSDELSQLRRIRNETAPVAA